KLRRKDQPALVVETRSVGAEKHRVHPPRPERRCHAPLLPPGPASLPVSPSRPTLLHFPPPATGFHAVAGADLVQKRTSDRVEGSGGRHGPPRTRISPRPTGGGPSARGAGGARTGNLCGGTWRRNVVEERGGGKWRRKLEEKTPLSVGPVTSLA